MDPSLVFNDETSSVCYVNTFNDSTGVMGYASFGMHDTDILAQTDWARPGFNFKPGAVAIINESTAGAGFRGGPAWWPTSPTSRLTGQTVLRVIAKYTNSTLREEMR